MSLREPFRLSYSLPSSRFLSFSKKNAREAVFAHPKPTPPSLAGSISPPGKGKAELAADKQARASLIKCP